MHFCPFRDIQSNHPIFLSIRLIVQLLMKDCQCPIPLHQFQLILLTHDLLRFLKDLHERGKLLYCSYLGFSFFGKDGDPAFGLLDQGVQDLCVCLGDAFYLVSGEGVSTIFLQHPGAFLFLLGQTCPRVIFPQSPKDPDLQESILASPDGCRQFLQQKQVEAETDIVYPSPCQTAFEESIDLLLDVEGLTGPPAQQMHDDHTIGQTWFIPILRSLRSIQPLDSLHLLPQNIIQILIKDIPQFLLLIRIGDEAILELDEGVVLLHIILFYKAHPMRGHNSSFLLTEQSKYQQQLFDKSINRVRKRINILSTSAVYSGGTEGTFERQKVNTSQIRREKLPGSGLCATVAKLTFDAEMIQQDIRGEMLQLRKSRQVVAILAQDLRRRTHKAQQQMRFQVQELRREVDAQREKNIERSRKLALQCEERRRGSEKLRERIQQAARRVKALESSLGCYTAVEKLNSV